MATRVGTREEWLAARIELLEQHTYTCYDRGTDVLNPTWQLLDRAPKGREDGVYPGWPKRRDEY